ncbi:MAG: radical SAM protein [Cyanobacteria bacterium HKST-UBA03]|nr:radical SAM protein [Cyanobacteria bacterium HKST-UBA03]
MAWLYPYTYPVAASALGYLSLFATLDQRRDVAIRRLTTDTLENESLHTDEALGVSFSFELDAIELIKALDTLGMPLFAADRDETAPLVFAGGPVVMTNPEPYADFFDFFLVGEGEATLGPLIDQLKALRGLPKAQKLLKLAESVPGIYVPSLYRIDYEPGGPIQAITPCHDTLPLPIRKQYVGDMSATIASSPILSPDAYFANTFLVEVMRGCPHRCRFCLASYSMLPARGPDFGLIRQHIERGLQYTRKIGLVGALISEHPEFEALCDYLRTIPDLQIGSASLRADTLTDDIARTFVHGGQKTVTLAVESGSERLRKRINKHLSTDAILNAADVVARNGIPKLKLYMMVGLPDETPDDLEASIALVKTLKQTHPALNIQFGCSTHVPKAATPFQWVARETSTELGKKHRYLQKQLAHIAQFRPSSSKWDTLQAVLARGDRRLSRWLVEFVRQGANLGAINRASKALQDLNTGNGGLEPIPPLAWYAERERPFNEVLAWDTLHLGVDKAVLYTESGLGATARATVFQAKDRAYVDRPTAPTPP